MFEGERASRIGRGEKSGEASSCSQICQGPFAESLEGKARSPAFGRSSIASQGTENTVKAGLRTRTDRATVQDFSLRWLRKGVEFPPAARPSASSLPIPGKPELPQWEIQGQQSSLILTDFGGCREFASRKAIVRSSDCADIEVGPQAGEVWAREGHE